MALYCPEMGVFDHIWELFLYDIYIWYNVTSLVRIKELFYEQNEITLRLLSRHSNILTNQKPR